MGERLGAIRDQHQLACARLADPDPLLQQGFPFSPIPLVLGLERLQVLTGGDVSPGAFLTESRLLELELEAFMSLCGEPKSQDRLMHMLENGKPLRN